MRENKLFARRSCGQRLAEEIAGGATLTLLIEIVHIHQSSLHPTLRLSQFGIQPLIERATCDLDSMNQAQSLTQPPRQRRDIRREDGITRHQARNLCEQKG